MELVGLVDMPRRLRALLDRAQPVAPNPDGWYRLSNATGDEDDTDTAELAIYSEISSWWGVGAVSFAEALNGVTARNLTVRLNSPGGSVFEGITIANLIRSHHANVTVVVDGIAASIASVIAMAGDTIVMQPQSQIMIHDASGICYGDPADMREMADLLDRQSENIATAYSTRAGGRRDSWRNRMRAETWYSDTEAVAAGLADKVAQYPRPAKTTAPEETETDEPDEDTEDLAARLTARWDLTIYRYAGREAAPAPDAKADGPVFVGETGPELIDLDGVRDFVEQKTGVRPGVLSVVPLDRAADQADAPTEPDPDDDDPDEAAQPVAATTAPPAPPAPVRLTFGRPKPATTRAFAFGRGGPPQ